MNLVLSDFQVEVSEVTPEEVISISFALMAPEILLRGMARCDLSWLGEDAFCEKLCVEIERAINIAMKSEIANEHNTWVCAESIEIWRACERIPYCLHVIVDGMID